jgi:hypothetical protein
MTSCMLVFYVFLYFHKNYVRDILDVLHYRDPIDCTVFLAREYFLVIKKTVLENFLSYTMKYKPCPMNEGTVPVPPAAPALSAMLR